MTMITFENFKQFEILKPEKITGGNATTSDGGDIDKEKVKLPTHGK